MEPPSSLTLPFLFLGIILILLSVYSALISPYPKQMNVFNEFADAQNQPKSHLHIRPVSWKAFWLGETVLLREFLELKDLNKNKLQ